MSRKRHHVVGALPDGATVFQDCETGAVRAMNPLQEGKPIPSDARLALAEPEDDGEHVMMQDLGDVHSGPAQVATASYRSGWDRTFSN